MHYLGRHNFTTYLRYWNSFTMIRRCPFNIVMLFRNIIGVCLHGEGKYLNALRWHSTKKEVSPAPPPPKKQKAAVDPRRIFKIYRYGGVMSKETPKLESFDLDISKCGPMLLDALIKLKDMDPTLTFRRSCREGICGSCAVNLQGYNCLSCITNIPDAKTIVVYPIPHMYVQRDLVVDMTHFMDAYDSIMPYLIRPRDSIKKGTGQYAQSVKDNLKLQGLYECVLCACCSTSCPSYWWNGRRFLGPAALLHAYRWIIDSRDDNTAERLHALRDDFKLFRCHIIMNCSISCPRGLRPAEAIVRLKKLVAEIDKKPPPDMDAMKYLARGASK